MPFSDASSDPPPGLCVPCTAAAEDRIEQMNAQRRRQRVAEHVREVERLCAYRRQLYEAMRVSDQAPACLRFVC